jgi:hypothetical protein
MSSKITAFGRPGGIRRTATLKVGDGLRCMSLRPGQSVDHFTRAASFFLSREIRRLRTPHGEAPLAGLPRGFDTSTLAGEHFMNAPINRRQAIAVASAVSLAAVRTAQAADEPKADPVRFDKPQAETTTGLAANSLTFSSNVSPDGRAVSMIFDKSMQFAFDNNDPYLTKTWAASIRIPRALQNMPPTVVFMGIVRGFMIKDSNARIAVSLDLGGVHHVVNFPFGGGASAQKDWTETVFSPLPTVEQQTQTPTGNTQVTQKLLDLGYYSIAVSVTMQRATTNDAALLKVDSIDVETLVPRFDLPARQGGSAPASTSK